MLGDDIGRVGASALQLVHGRVVVGEFPVQLVVLMQLVHDALPHVQLGGTARVLVHHADREVAGVVVGVPEPDDVVPGVQRGNHHEGEHDHERLRRFQKTQKIALEYLQNIPHETGPFRLQSVSVQSCR